MTQILLKQEESNDGNQILFLIGQSSDLSSRDLSRANQFKIFLNFCSFLVVNTNQPVTLISLWHTKVRAYIFCYLKAHWQTRTYFQVCLFLL